MRSSKYWSATSCGVLLSFWPSGNPSPTTQKPTLRNMNLRSSFMLNCTISHIQLDSFTPLQSPCMLSFSPFFKTKFVFRWAFLETLGFFSFLGVALIDTHRSQVLSLAICMITVFSISILCFVIADLDDPFSGFFRLDLSLLNVVMARGKRMWKQLEKSEIVIHNFPTAWSHPLSWICSAQIKLISS